MLFVTFLFFILAASAHAQTSGEFVTFESVRGRPYNVTYDARSFIVDGRRTVLLGGSVHYPRFTPGQWPDVLQKLKNDGLNHVEVYVFWNLHERWYNLSGVHEYDFTGRGDLAAFLTVASATGLFCQSSHWTVRVRRMEFWWPSRMAQERAWDHVPRLQPTLDGCHDNVYDEDPRRR